MPLIGGGGSSGGAVNLGINADDAQFQARMSAVQKSISGLESHANAKLKSINAEAAKLNQQIAKQEAWNNMKAGATKAFAAIGVGLVAAGKAYNEIIGKTQRYAKEVRDLSIATGAGAEQASRYIQVLGDFEISTTAMTSAMKKMKDNGMVPTIDSLAKISAGFLAIEDPAKRLEFAYDNLGKSADDFLVILEQGPDKILAMNDAVSQNLILTEEQIKQSEQYRLKMDQVGDTIEGYKIKTAMAFFENQTAIDGTRASLEAYGYSAIAVEGMIFSQTKRVQEINTEYARATEYGLAWEAALSAQGAALDQENMALQENTHLLGENTAAMEEARTKQEEYKTGVGDLVGQLATGAISQEEFNSKLNALHASTTTKALPAFDAIIDHANQTATALKRPSGAAQELGADVPVNMGAAAAGVESAADRMGEVLKDPISDITTLNGKIEATAAKSGSHWEFSYAITGTGRFPNFPALNQANQAQVNQCFIAGTPVTMADGSQKPIEAVEVGDEVLTYDFKQRKNVTEVVTQVFHHPAKQTNWYLKINGIGVTDNHLMWTPEGWTGAGNIKIGDCLVAINGEFIPVTSIETVTENAPTYNLHVDNESHNYYAAGVLVHNKAGGGQVFGPGDGSRDTFLAPLANEEFVVRSSVVKKPGVLQFLTNLNNGRTSGFAHGGLVRLRNGLYVSRRGYMRGGPVSSGPVINQQQRDRDRELSSIPSSSIPTSTSITESVAGAALPTVAYTGGYGGGAGGGSMSSSQNQQTLASTQSAQSLMSIDQKMSILIGAQADPRDFARAAATAASLQS